MHNKAEIVLSTHAGDSHIKIDGEEIKGVTKVVVSQAVGEIPSITLDLLIDALHITAEGELHQRPEQWPVITSGPGHVFHRPRGWNPYDGCHE